MTADFLAWVAGTSLMGKINKTCGVKEMSVWEHCRKYLKVLYFQGRE